MTRLRARTISSLLILGIVTLPLAACTNSGPRDDAPGATSTPAADNTARNAADSSGIPMTPLDQGENDVDRGITRTIRQLVVGDATLSMNAHNIKIITLAGTVTLRGPVNSAEEADRLVKVAEGVAGVSRVDSQLEVVQH